jgi:hypothetical protein
VNLLEVLPPSCPTVLFSSLSRFPRLRRVANGCRVRHVLKPVDRLDVSFSTTVCFLDSTRWSNSLMNTWLPWSPNWKPSQFYISIRKEKTMLYNLLSHSTPA